MRVRGVLAFVWTFMIELSQCLVNVTRHAQVDLAFLIVPVKCNADILPSGPVFFNSVFVRLDSSNKV